MRMLFSLFMTVAAPPDAGGDAQLRPVMIDWADVSDATVHRCGLGLLQSLLLQGMVESGFAVVDIKTPRVITVTLRERKGAVLVEAQRDDLVARRRVAVPARCDSTIGVDLQAAARATALEVEQLVKAREPATGATSEAPAPPTSPLWAEPPSHPEGPRSEAIAPVTSDRGLAHTRARIGVGASMSRADSPFAALTAQLGGRLGAWSVAAAFDGALRSSLGVTVFEPALGPELGRIIRLGAMELGIAGAVQLLGHAWWRDGERGGHLDVRFSLPLRLEHSATGLGLALVPSVRLRPVEHDVRGARAYVIDHFGGLVALTFRVPP